MYLDKRIKRRIARVFARMQGDAMLLGPEGQVILPEDRERPFPLPEALKSNPTAPVYLGGYTVVGTDESQPLYLCLPGETEENCNAAILCAGMVAELAGMELPGGSQEYAYQYILQKQVEEAEIAELAREYGIEMNACRCVLLLSAHAMEMEAAMAILANALDENEGKAVEVDRYTAALILRCDEKDMDEPYQLALAIENTFMTEANSTVYIGLGEPKKTLGELRESLWEARRAMEVGRIYDKGERVFRFRTLLSERFCADVPREMAQPYIQALFNKSTARLFNDVMMQTIDAFFANSLNLSETARKLYIHRNTLIYRLDKVQKAVGLDLKSFDDAAAFWLLTMLAKAQDRTKGK